MNQDNQLLEELKKQYKNMAEKPFIVSVFGQTGVGKSSLINALFGTNLPTDPIKPCTKEIEKIEAINQKGFSMWFYDLPGFGESENLNDDYINQYIEQVRQSDVILWAIHADNRSVTFDLSTLKKIMNNLTLSDQKKLINNLTFVLTKADMLCQPPWIYVLDKLDNGFFTIGKELRNIFEQKCDYFQEIFLNPYSNLIENSTFNDSNFSLSIPNISFDNEKVLYKGIMKRPELDFLCNEYQEYNKIFRRLYDNYRPVYCSSKFKFNLSKILLLIASKITNEASIRINNFLDINAIDSISLSSAQSFSNMIIYKQDTKTINL
jgi:GTP-binding protein EngB required for normal cell division